MDVFSEFPGEWISGGEPRLPSAWDRLLVRVVLLVSAVIGFGTVWGMVELVKSLVEAVL